MTDDKKHDDKDRKKLSDEEMEDVAGGYQVSIDTKGRSVAKGKKKGGDKKRDSEGGLTGNPIVFD